MNGCSVIIPFGHFNLNIHKFYSPLPIHITDLNVHRIRLGSYGCCQSFSFACQRMIPVISNYCLAKRILIEYSCNLYFITNFISIVKIADFCLVSGPCPVERMEGSLACQAVKSPHRAINNHKFRKLTGGKGYRFQHLIQIRKKCRRAVMEADNSKLILLHINSFRSRYLKHHLLRRIMDSFAPSIYNCLQCNIHSICRKLCTRQLRNLLHRLFAQLLLCTAKSRIFRIDNEFCPCRYLLAGQPRSRSRFFVGTRNQRRLLTSLQNNFVVINLPFNLHLNTLNHSIPHGARHCPQRDCHGIALRFYCADKRRVLLVRSAPLTV